jgi:hypothetical protein
MTTTAADIQIGVNLIDDYLSLAEAPVADDLVGRFLVVQDLAKEETASELLTVAPNGDLAHFYPDTSSHSGWALGSETVTSPVTPGDTTIKRLTGFYAKGVLQSLCYFDTDETGVEAAAWMASTAPGTWTNAPLTSDAKNALYYTYQTDTYVDANGINYVYGITKGLGDPAFFLVMYDDTENQWDVEYAQYLSMFSEPLTPSAAFRIAPGASSDALTVLWVEPGTTSIYYRYATMTDGTFSWNGDTQPPIDTSAYGAITVDRIYPFAGTFGEDNLLLLDTSGALYVIGGFNQQSPSVTRLTNPSAAQGINDPIDQPQPVGAFTADAGLDSAGNQRIVALETGTNSLWYMTIDADGQFDPTADWVNLGGPFETIGCPTSMIYGPELFAIDLNNSVYHKALTPQDPNNQVNPVWVTKKLAQPVASTATPQNVSLYSMQLQIVDANGNPVGSQVIDVTADHAATVVVNDVAHAIGPNTSVPISTDTNGQVTVMFEAVDLKPPVITFTVSGTSATRWCQGDSVQIKSTDTNPITPPPQSMSNRLQNNDPTRAVSNDSLTTAQTQPGTCPATGVDKSTPQLMSASYASGDPSGSACTSLINAGSWMDPNNTHDDGTIDASKLPVRHWRIDFAHPGGVVFEILSEEEARRLFAKTNLGGSSHTFGGVCEFFKHMFHQLNTFAATVAKNVQTGLYELTIAFNDTMSFIISTAKEAGAATETIFSKIAAGIEAVANDVYEAIKRVIEWLKMLFDWQDIINTHKAIMYVVKQSLFTNLENAVAGAETDVSKWFGSLKTDVTNVFDNLEQHFDSSTSFNDYANNAQSTFPSLASSLASSSGNALAGTTTLNTQQQHASKCHYVKSRSQSSFGTMGTTPTASSSDPTTAIVQAIQTGIMDPTNANGQSLFTSFSNELLDFLNDTFSNPSDFFDLVILAFLESAKDLVLFIIDVLEAVLEAFLQLLEDALKQLEGMVTGTITIPIISWLWKNVISGQDLSLLDLFCLLLAVPSTILYKILYGGSNASPPFTTTTLNELTSNPLAWPSLPTQSAPDAQLRAPVGYTPPSKDVLLPLGILAGLSYVVTGWCEMTTDLKAALGEDDTAARNYSILAIVIAAYQIGATAPYSLFAESPGDWKDADRWALNAWFTGIFITSCDTCFVALSASHTATKFVEGAGPVGDSAMGVCQEAIGIVTCIYQSQSGSGYTNWDCAGNIIGPIDECLKFMIEGSPYLQTALVTLDFFLPVGTCVTTCGSAVHG